MLIKLILTALGITGLLFGILTIEQEKSVVESNRPAIELPPGVTQTFSARAQRYFVWSKDYPRFTEAIFDPFDPKVGEIQRVIVKVQNPRPLQSVNALLKTDSLEGTYELQLVGGTVLEGVWGGSWKIEDTNDEIYRVTLRAADANGKTSIDEFVFK